MFSLRKQISNLDDLSEIHRSLTEAYGAAIDAVAERMPDSPKELFEDPRRNLKSLKSAAQSSLPKSDLQKLAQQVTAQITDYGQRISGYLKRQQKETKDILDLLSSVTDTVSKRDKENSVRLQSISKKLRLLTTTDDLAEIKWKLAQEVEQFEKSIADMDRTNEAALDRLRDSVKRVEPAPSRPAATAAASTPFPRKPGVRFCLGLIQLSAPSSEASALISTRIDADDRVEKLSDLEYLVLKAGTLIETADLLELLRRELERHRIDAQVGAAEQTRGESKEELLARARESFRPRK